MDKKASSKFTKTCKTTRKTIVTDCDRVAGSCQPQILCRHFIQNENPKYSGNPGENLQPSFVSSRKAAGR